jgi:transposase-like protein
MTTIDRSTDAKRETQRRRRFTPGDRKRLMSLFKRSGQSAKQFCREHDVCPSSLWRWLGRDRQSGQEPSRVGELVEIPMGALRVSDMAGAAVTMEITGVGRLEVVVGTDPKWLGALVRALPPARQ